jgi:hypothetical protein
MDVPGRPSSFFFFRRFMPLARHRRMKNGAAHFVLLLN